MRESWRNVDRPNSAYLPIVRDNAFSDETRVMSLPCCVSLPPQSLPGKHHDKKWRYTFHQPVLKHLIKRIPRVMIHRQWYLYHTYYISTSCCVGAIIRNYNPNRLTITHHIVPVAFIDPRTPPTVEAIEPNGRHYFDDQRKEDADDSWRRQAWGDGDTSADRLAMKPLRHRVAP